MKKREINAILDHVKTQDRRLVGAFDANREFMAEVRRKAERIDDLSAKNERLESVNKDLGERYMKASERVGDLNAEAEALEGIITSLQGNITNLQDDVRQHKHNREHFEALSNGYRNDYGELVGINNRLQVQLCEESARLAKAKELAAKHYKALKEARAAIKHFEANAIADKAKALAAKHYKARKAK